MREWFSNDRLEAAYRYGPVVVPWFLGGFVTSLFFLFISQGLLSGPQTVTADLILYGVALYAGYETVLHRTGWRGRQLKPRLMAWWAVAILLMAAILGALIGLVFDNFADFDAIAGAHDLFNAGSRVPDLWRVMTINTFAKAAAFRLYINLIALLACGTLIIQSPMPRQWAEFRRFRVFLLAVVALAGRPLTGDIYALMAKAEPSASLDFFRLILAPVLMPLAGVLTLAFLGILIGTTIMLAVFVFVMLPLMIHDFIAQREQNAEIRAQKKIGLENDLWRFDAWLRHDKRPPPPDDSKGARFMTPSEVDRVRQAGGFSFGHLDEKPLFLNTDKHVLLMASTRSGKGVTVIIPHLLRYPGSAFVLDPKGENARATGRQRAALNTKVHYLDPFGISGLAQSRFNPLASFTADNMEANSKALAAALVLNQQRDHWSAAGQQLLAAIILHVVTSASFPPETKDLVTVRRLLLGAIQPTLTDMSASDAADGLIADLAASFLSTPEKEFGSIVSTAQRETEILDNPYIAKCLAASGAGEEVDFGDWHRGTMSVFLCLSAPKFPVFNRWLRLVLTSALDEMTDQLDAPKLPVCFMLDELATLGHLGVIENAIGLAAGYGIQLVAVFQDIAQMKDLYKGRWASFIGNAGIRALFSLDDFDTARYWSDFIGMHLVSTLSQSQDIYGFTKGQTAGETNRPLLTPEQIMLRYATDRMLVLKQGLRPIEAEQVPYWADRSLRGLWDDPRIRPRPPAPPQPKQAVNVVIDIPERSIYVAKEGYGQDYGRMPIPSKLTPVVNKARQ